MGFCFHLTVKKCYAILMLFWILSLLNCQSEKKTDCYEEFAVDENLPQNDTIKLFSRYPELKLFNNERLESQVRTAYIVQRSSYSDGFYDTPPFQFNDYKSKAEDIGDTINIWLNNNNGHFENGVLVKVFNGRFLIKDIDP